MGNQTSEHLSNTQGRPEFRVWAPAARRVSLLLDSDGDKDTVPMTRLENGWWGVPRPEGSTAVDYGFSVDGSGPLPDPRSASQPRGIHGLSRLVDHSRFVWTDQTWNAPPLRSGVIYELHIGTFTPEGTFESAIARLDHLTGLGVTHIELMPVAEFPGDRGWGYDGVDLYAPHHAYGGPEGLKHLVNACHARGLAVLLDVVYNHLGPEGNYISQFGPYFSNRHKTPWGDSMNFDGENSTEVRRFLIDNALMWLRDYHFDGLRLDAVHAIFDTSATHFLEQLAREVDEFSATLGRNLALIAESDLNDPRLVASWNLGGYGIDAQWSDDFHHALHVALTGENHGYYADFGGIGQVSKALTDYFVFDGAYSPYRKRSHGRAPTGLAGHRFVIGLQNHDQIGNRAAGERTSQLLPYGGLLTGAAILLTAANVPMLFQGEEWGASTPFQYFAAHEDQDLAEAVSRGRKQEFVAFGWRPEDVPDPQARATFERSKLNWAELQSEPHRSILDWHRALIRLRRQTPSLLSVQPPAVTILDASTLRIVRGAVELICHLERSHHYVEVSRDHQLILSSRAWEAERLPGAPEPAELLAY